MLAPRSRGRMGGLLRGLPPMTDRLENFQEKACPALDAGWNAFFRSKMRQSKKAGAASVSSLCETAPASARRGACLLAALALAGLCGCAADRPPPTGEPRMYVSMAAAGAELGAPAPGARVP